MRRLVAQAVVSVTEACSRPIAGSFSEFGAETGAAIALLIAMCGYKVLRCSCSGFLRDRH